MKKTKILSKVYKKAKKTIIIDKEKYYIYAGVFRREKNFKNLIPLFREESKNIKILLDNKSDVCLIYGTKKVKRLLKNKNRFP